MLLPREGSRWLQHNFDVHRLTRLPVLYSLKKLFNFINTGTDECRDEKSFLGTKQKIISLQQSRLVRRNPSKGKRREHKVLCDRSWSVWRKSLSNVSSTRDNNVNIYVSVQFCLQFHVCCSQGSGLVEKNIKNNIKIIFCNDSWWDSNQGHHKVRVTAKHSPTWQLIFKDNTSKSLT